jgi:hypothetical protein
MRYSLGIEAGSYVGIFRTDAAGPSEYIRRTGPSAPTGRILKRPLATRERFLFAPSEGIRPAASLLMRRTVVFVSDALDRLCKVSFRLAQRLRASDFGTGLLDGLIGQIHRLSNRRVEGLFVVLRHGNELAAQWGQTLAFRDPDNPAASPKQWSPAPPRLPARLGTPPPLRCPSTSGAAVAPAPSETHRVPLGRMMPPALSGAA